MCVYFFVSVQVFVLEGTPVKNSTQIKLFQFH